MQICNKPLILSMVAIFSILLFVTPIVAGDHMYKVEIKPDAPVWINTEVTVTASTDDPTVDKVVFEWIDPHGTTRKTFTDTAAPFQDSYTLDELGDWQVTATFKEGIKRVAIIEVVITVIPELGTMMVMIASFGALAALATRKRL